MNNTKRIISALIAFSIVLSALSVGSVALAEGSHTMPSINTENVYITDGDTVIGSVDHYANTGDKPGDNDFLDSLKSEHSKKLNHVQPVTEVFTKQSDGSYKGVDSSDVSGFQTFNNSVATGTCQNGTSYNREMAKVNNKDVIGKVYGWDGQGYYYYNSADSAKIRDASVTTPYAYETYTYSFEEGTYVSDFIIANAREVSLRSSFYEIYANVGEASDLYDPENLLYVYDSGTLSTAAFASHYHFDKTVKATNFGIKLINPINSNVVGKEHYYSAARIAKLDVYGTDKYVMDCTVSYEENSLPFVKTTETNPESNYSIPTHIRTSDSEYQPIYTYYRNNIPTAADVRGTLPYLWDGASNGDVQFCGTETYWKDSAKTEFAYYEDTYSELFYDFGAIYEVNEILIGNHNVESLKFSGVALYAAMDYSDLFKEENKLISVSESFSSLSVATDKIEARYVGIKIEDSCRNNENNSEGYGSSKNWIDNDYLRLTEFDVFGKYKKADPQQSAAVVNFPSSNKFTDVAAAVKNKVSLLSDLPKVERVMKGEVKKSQKAAAELITVSDGSLDEEIRDGTLRFFDEAGAPIYDDIYVSFLYDLKKVQPIKDILVAHAMGFVRTGYYKVYVSRDAEIDEADAVAKVHNMGGSDYANNCANLITLPNGTEGRYVEIRVIRPVANVGSTANGQPSITANMYYRMREINVYADTGYSVSGGIISEKEYFSNNSEKIKTSLIADTAVYDVENINSFNFGTHKENAGNIAYGGVNRGSEKWSEASKEFTATEYRYTDGDWNGVSFTKTIYSCSGTEEHKEACSDADCTGVAKRINDGSVYQTIIYKLPLKSAIEEVDIFFSKQTVRLPSHYEISFADSAEELFGSGATTYEVSKTGFNTYDLITLNNVVKAEYFALRVLCGVHATIEGSDAVNHNFARVGHIALYGENLGCDEGVHRWERQIETEATCLKGGVEFNKCKVCDVEQERVQVPPNPNNHTPSEVVLVPETCTESGLKGLFCTECETVFESGIVVPPSHKEAILPAKVATCTEAGLSAGKVCTVCGVITLPQETVPTLPHKWQAGEQRELENCGGTIRIDTCQNGCGTTNTVVINANGHNEVTIPSKPATCTKIGYGEGKKCTECGEITEKPPILAPLGHSEETLPSKAPGCTSTGLTAGKICSVCHEVTKVQSILPALGHTEKTMPSVAPTCTEDGATEWTKCRVCGETVTPPEAVSATGHTYVAIVTEEPTCTKEGVETYVCHCNDTYTKPIPAKGHKESLINKVEPTCQRPGSTEGKKCSDCGEILLACQKISELPHANAVKTTAATFKKNGKLVNFCKNCGRVESSVAISKLESVKLSAAEFTYNGKAKKPSVTVKDSKGRKVSSKFYTVSYASGRKRVGKYKVTVKFKGNYSGSKTLYFTIVPKAVKNLKLKSSAKKQLTVSWKKDSKVSGYKIVYATNSKFTKGKKTITVKSYKTYKKTVKSLKSKGTYYVKARAFKKVSGTTYYGAYCATKKLKIK